MDFHTVDATPFQEVSRAHRTSARPRQPAPLPLLLIAFLASILRVPTAVLEIAGKAPNQGPVWYSVLTVVVALTQVGIALAMVVGYRKAGI